MSFIHVTAKTNTDEFRRLCTARFGKRVILEQEQYLSEHPEVGALLKVYMKEMVVNRQLYNTLKTGAKLRPLFKPRDQLERNIAQFLNTTKKDNHHFTFVDKELTSDLVKFVEQYYPDEEWSVPSVDISIPTESSSFLSIITSEVTIPTPEPVRTPEPTMSRIMYAQISNVVDKAVYGQVTAPELKYDTAYVELIKAVEVAMEIPVIEIRADMVNLYHEVYHMFELNIMEKERIAAEIAWEKRMRKKLKRLLRRQNNFKGYESPPSSKSEASTHESYLIPPLQPCECPPQYRFNRYAKDKYGIYKPRTEHFSNKNVTVTPAVSMTDINEGK